MKFMTGNELREKYLQFFASKDHLVLPSYSLIPENDPTLLMVGAGMAPFKPFFTGKMKPPHPRITTSQKCVRTGDIENVGKTARHHTFFEMLGNFSFGDYFKREAIAWAWEFITKHLEIPEEQLWVTIYPDDEEAFDIWTKEVGVNPKRVVKLEDNFWEIGPGPCGPCSEIYVDLGPERGCSDNCVLGCDCDRYLEIWNLVFTQFDRDEAGNYNPLAKKNIDTGAGLERIASVLQNKKSNFETDLIFPIIEYASKVSGVKYETSTKNDISLKVIADHARSMTIMILDGILPSNEGRGYVLRRIIRRAIRHGRLLGIETSFLAGAVDAVITIFGNVYPELVEKQDYIRKVISLEEERFHTTLAQGIELLSKLIADLKVTGKDVLDGKSAFKLYDTFGFPWELTAEILEENKFSLDKDAFDAAMNEQRERARAARQENQRVSVPDLTGINVDSLKQDYNVTTAKVVLLWKDGKAVEQVHDGEEVGIILDTTAFYAEGGGQAGDTGMIETEVGKVEIENAKKLANGTIYHIGMVVEGLIKVGDNVKILIDAEVKQATARNHTATHLLHAALKNIVGEHVNQAGSSVNSERLRFDFSHFEPLTTEQIEKIEQQVNEAILKAITVDINETTQNEAKEMGAMALFGEKYGDIVRVVNIKDFSVELCGGTHVNNVAEIGLFKIVSEAGVASGVRRIEAITGKLAYDKVNIVEKTLNKTASLLKSRNNEVVEKIEALLTQVKTLEQQLAVANSKMAQETASELLATAIDVNGVTIVNAEVEIEDMDGLRNLADLLRDKLTVGVIVLGAKIADDKVNFVVMATKDAVAKGIHAGNIIKETAKVAGGGGGGRPDMAQAGGKNPKKITEALTMATEVITKQIG
ncbi:MAG: alanine--tRNA ligase [Negativicutes bacterium]|nr:alanine--tRNA ligase [Negativicutes bacterium]MBP8628950.1 alanine--tRNA ligase [Negativicutes bacterium]MBP9948607.1 alanine--tRNA ligase [Negativicutes bacterium]